MTVGVTEDRLPAGESSRSGRLASTIEALRALGWKEGLALLAPFVALMALGLYHIDAHSFWRDEVASVFFSQHSVGELVMIIGRHRAKVGLANMATYYLVLHFWMLLGETEARIRLLSVIAAAATVIPIYFTARRIAGWWAGATAAAVFALHPFVIRYSQEARGYSLSMLVVAGLTWLLLIAVERRSAWWWAAYGVVGGLGLYVHFFVALTIAAHGLWVLASRNIPPWRSLAAVLIPLALAAAPVPLIVLQYGGGHGWINGVSAKHVIGLLLFLGGGAFVLLAITAASGVAVFVRRRDPRMWLILATALFPIVATILVSFVKPLLLARYLIICLPPMAVMAGIGIVLLRPRLLQAGAAVAVAAALLLAVPNAYTDRHQQDWRGLGRWISETVEPGNLVAMQGWGRRSLDYYLARFGAKQQVAELPAALVAKPDPAQLWVVITEPPPGRRSDAALEPLLDRYEVVTRRLYGRKVVAYLLVLRAESAAAP